MADKTYTGKCFCGAVELHVTGAPAAMGYCHCASCRSWSAGPVNAFTLWQPDAVKVTKGDDQVGTYHKTDKSRRKWCKRCGGHLFTEHPLWLRNPKTTMFRETIQFARQVGHAGPPGRKATEVLTKYIVVDMFAKAIQGTAPEDAVKWAHDELVKIYT